MKYGLTPQQHQFIEMEVIQPLKEYGHTVYIFGSRARGDFKKFSDLDLMIEGAPTKKSQQVVSSLREKLSNSNFPYKVDLVFLNEFAESYRTNYEQERHLWI